VHSLFVGSKRVAALKIGELTRLAASSGRTFSTTRIIAIGHEADVLTVRLAGNRQFEVAGDLWPPFRAEWVANAL
jgi:hypothetical protein